jgi:DNA polymerase-3 subunit epsilon
VLGDRKATRQTTTKHKSVIPSTKGYIVILVLDTETTGLPARRNASYTELSVWPRIVTVSWAVFRSRNDCVSHKHFIVRPDGFRIPPAATQIHGISHARAQRDGQPLAAVLEVLRAEVGQLGPKSLVCHNVAFDRPIVLAEILRTGMQPQFLERLPTYCTMEATTDYCAIPGMRGFKYPSLRELYAKLFGRPMQGAHNAAQDVLACAECFYEYSSRAPGVATLRTSARAAQPAKDESAEIARSLIESIYDFANEQPDFDTDFVDSLSSQLDERGYLTDRQIAALNNIVERWGIE